MKKFILAAIALATITTTSFAESSAVVENFTSTCTKKTVVTDPETQLPKSRTNSFSMASQLYISHDQLEETEIYSYLAASDDNGDLGMSKDSGVANLRHVKLSETETKTIVSDTFEYSVQAEAEKPVFMKESTVSESVWRSLEKTAVKDVSLRTSHLVNGKEDKEQVLRTKTILSPTEYTIDLMTLNPQEVLKGGEQLVFSIKSCHYKK